jgi:hypothetical protein
VLIPRLEPADEARVGRETNSAWELWADASRLEGETAEFFEAELERAYEANEALAA